jgi:hypothetical protein
MMLTGLPLYAGIGALVVILALSGALWVEHGRLEGKTDQLAAQKLLVSAWEAKVTEKQQVIDTLESTIAEQNRIVKEAADLGELAQERQRTIDRLLAERARATEDLATISDAYRRLREDTAGFSACQTYERVFRSIAAGGGGP